MMNWNYNDTKYILKRLIIFLLIGFAIFIFGTWKAKAYTLSKPTQFTMQLANVPDDGNYSYLSNTNITNLSFIEDNRYWNVFNYNDTARIRASFLYWNFQQNEEYKILKFRYAFDITELAGTAQDLDVNSVYVELPDYVYQPCGVKSRGVVERLTNVSTAVYEIECVATTQINSIQIFYRHNMDFNFNRNFFIGEDMEVQIVDEAAFLDELNSINEYNKWYAEYLANNDVNSSIDETDNFWNNSLFDDSTGLQAVITLPLNMINNLTNTCQPITLPLPFVNGTATLPCMSTIYQQHFSSLYSVIALIVNGFFVYRILLKIYELVHDAKDPAKDKLEVVEL